MDQVKEGLFSAIQFEIEGRKYIIISHYTGKKDLDEVVYRNAYNQAMDEVLHA